MKSSVSNSPANSWKAFLLVAMLCVAAVSAYGRAWAHGGEDHGGAKPATAELIGPRIEAHSDLFELVGIPSARDGGVLTVFIDGYKTNVPVTDAGVELTVGNETLPGVAANQMFFFKAPWVLKPGHYDLTFSIVAGDKSDLLIGRLDIPDAPLPAAMHESVWDHVLPADWHVAAISHWLLMLVALVAVALTFAASRLPSPLRGALLAAAVVAGLGSLAVAATLISGGTRRVAKDETAAALLDLPETSRRLGDGAIFVPKPAQRLFGVTTDEAAQSTTVHKSVRLVGQVIPDPNRSGLVQALLAGRIEPPESGFPSIGNQVKKGEVLGYLVPRVEVVDQSDIRQTQGDLDRQIELAEAKLRRIEPLGGGAIPQAQVVDSKIELEALKKRRAAIKPVLAERETLVAPADGVLAQMNVAAGQVVEAQTLLFQIVDPDNLWVEALAFDNAIAMRIEKGDRNAVASTADGRKLTLAFAGRAIALRQQAVPLRFKVQAGQDTLSVGEPVTVEASIDETTSSIPVPRSSVVRGANGQSILYAHSGAERFEPIVVQTAPLDAERVAINAGLDPGVRLVVRGAELINQVR